MPVISFVEAQGPEDLDPIEHDPVAEANAHRPFSTLGVEHQFQGHAVLGQADRRGLPGGIDHVQVPARALAGFTQPPDGEVPKAPLDLEQQQMELVARDERSGPLGGAASGHAVFVHGPNHISDPVDLGLSSFGDLAETGAIVTDRIDPGTETATGSGAVGLDGNGVDLLDGCAAAEDLKHAVDQLLGGGRRGSGCGPGRRPGQQQDKNDPPDAHGPPA